MNNNQSSQFYRKEVADLINARLDRIENKLDGNTAEIAKINAKFSYIFGIAAGITLVINVVWIFIKDKILRL